MRVIVVENTEIRLLENKKEDFVSLTDVASRFGEARIIIQNWMRTRGTLDFLGTWEELHNPDFKRIEFDAFKMESGTNIFSMSPEKWIEGVNASGMFSKRGRYGSGTFAHRDIALGFCYWLNPAFQLFLIKEFQRLKEDESERHQLDWDVRRVMASANYRIHTDAVRRHLVPPLLQNTDREAIIMASEADLLNLALFGMTAKQWRLHNPEAKGNLRDNASPEQLLVLSNLQSLNGRLLKWGCDKEQRLQILNETAVEEMSILLSSSALKALPTTADEPKKLNG